MGATVAAHLANAGIPTLVLDLAPTETAENGLKALAKARPAPLAHPSRQALLTAGNFDDDLAKLADVDWVIEAVVEDLGIKTALFARVAEHLNDRAIITSNSSGLSMNAMADALPEALRPRFFGAHFFNPPRYMYLLEVIPTGNTDPRLVDEFADFAALRLGKGVVRCNDAPMFVANRVGMFTTVHAMNKMGDFGLDGRGGRRGQRTGHRPRRHGDLRHRRPGRLGHPRSQRRHASRATPRTTRCSISGSSRIGCCDSSRAVAPATRPAAASSRTGVL